MLNGNGNGNHDIEFEDHKLTDLARELDKIEAKSKKIHDNIKNHEERVRKTLEKVIGSDRKKLLELQGQASYIREAMRRHLGSGNGEVAPIPLTVKTRQPHRGSAREVITHFLLEHHDSPDKGIKASDIARACGLASQTIHNTMWKLHTEGHVKKVSGTQFYFLDGE